MRSLRKLSSLLEKHAFGIGATSLLVAFYSIASITAISGQLLRTADETLHLDYAWQVAHGSLPEFTEGAKYTTTFAYTPPVQWVWQHPPLFYALISPVVDIASSTTSEENVVIYGRLATAMLGTLSVASIMTFVYNALPSKRYRKLATLTSGMLVSISTPLLGVSASIYNDTVPLSLTAFTLALVAYMLKTDRLTFRYFLALTTLLSLGMLSRSAFIITLLISLGALAVGIYCKHRSSFIKYTYIVSAGVLALLASGWFYLRNYELSGNILGRSPVAEYVPRVMEGRVKTSLIDQLSSYEFWSVAGSVTGSRLALLLYIFLILIAAYVAHMLFKHIKSKSFSIDSEIVIVIAIFGLLQIVAAAYYMSGGGGHHTRYLIPLLVPIAYFTARFTMLSKPKPGYFTIGAGSLYILSIYLYLRDIAAQHLEEGQLYGSTSLLQLLNQGLALNDVDRVYLSGLLLGVIALSSLLVTFSIYFLARRRS